MIMQILLFVVGALSLILRFLTAQSIDQIPFSTFTPSTYLNSTGLTDDVQWDGYSLFVKGHRVYVYSGEIHNFRNVNPALYPDLMQRIKGLGFNAISSYYFWAFHNPSPGVLDFDGWKALEPFLEAANDAGLWVIARPGPWVQGEFAASGTPAWVTGLNVSLRTSDPTFIEAYTPFWEAVGKVLAEYQVTRGGPVIAVQMENEYYLDAAGDVDLNYIVDIETKMRSYGVVVPLTFNDNPLNGVLYEGKGAVNLYGGDSYPQNSNCSMPDFWTPVQTYTRPFFQNTTNGPTGEPFFIPEYQGGWIPGTDTEGFTQCLPLFSSQFERVFYLGNVAQSIKMQNVYMIYGGTNFGHTGYSRALTSYDYWAAIEENRSLRDKYYELKVISHFIRSARDLPKTWVAESGNTTGTSAPGEIQVDELRNPDTAASFYVVRQANSTLDDVISFDLDVTDWQGNTTVPITLNGRDSRIVVSNYCWGASCISHSSASVMTSTSFGEVDYLVLYGDPGQPYTLAFPDPDCKIEQLSGSPAVVTSSSHGRTLVDYSISAGESSVLKVNGGTREVRVVILNTAVAYFAWEVVIPQSGDFANHYLIGSNETALVIGPYFVRSASASGSTLNLQGDLNTTTTVYIVAPPSFTSFTWNNATITPTLTSTGLLSISLPGPTSIPSAPAIIGWKWKDSLPEIGYGYDDSGWVVANDTTTNNTNVPFPEYNGKYVLYGQNYGYAIGSFVLRGRWMASGEETGLNVSLSAGTFGCGAFYLNGEYLGSAVVENVIAYEEINTTIAFPSGSVKPDQDNYIQVVIANAGLEEGSTFTATPQDAQSPRGIRGYTLLGGDPSGYELIWKIQGNQGGWTDFPDKVRSLYNVGGLYGEREGWHLPGFDDSDWEEGCPEESLDMPGVRFYRASVDVDYPAGLDIHYSFVFPRVMGAYRAQLFVNGWQFGIIHGELVDTQKTYPVPPGVLVQGTNTVALSFFAYNDTASALSLGGEVTVQVDRTITTSVLDLRGVDVESPSWAQVMGAGGGSFR